MEALLLSLGLLLFLGVIFGGIAQKICLPALVGYLFVGIFLGKSGVNWLAPSLLEQSGALRQLALILILLKAGLSLDVRRLVAVGRPALLMSCLPACFEVGAVTLLAPLFFPVTRLEAALLGAVLAAVSPAVVVPRMSKMIEESRGKGHKVPEIVLAGASLDDVFVISLFTVLLAMTEGGEVSPGVLLEVPVAILSGIFVGILLAFTLKRLDFFQKLRPEGKILLLLALSAVMVGLAPEIPVAFSPLLGVMCLAMGLGGQGMAPVKSGLNSLWVGGELLLFALVGAEIQVEYALEAGVSAVLLLLLGLSIRSFGVVLATAGTELTPKERLFCLISYLPKATVQAAIGGVPLAVGLDCGSLILTVAVVAILVTAPLGAYLMDRFCPLLCPVEE